MEYIAITKGGESDQSVSKQKRIKYVMEDIDSRGRGIIREQRKLKTYEINEI